MPHTKSWAKLTKKDKLGFSGLSFLGLDIQLIEQKSEKVMCGWHIQIRQRRTVKKVYIKRVRQKML